MTEDRHWVEELFPPVYAIDGEEVQQDLDDVVKGQTKTTTNVYELAANRISRYDPDTIKNVYERVWLLTTVEEQERKRRELLELERKKKEVELQKQAEEEEKQKRTQKLTGGDPTGTLVLEALQLKEPDIGKIDTEDSSLWSSEELSVLREVFNAARKENIRLKAELHDAKQTIKKLEMRHDHKSSTLTNKESVLSEAKKANARLHLLATNLKKQMDKLGKENDELLDTIQEMKEQQLQTERELRNTRKEFDSERLRRQNLAIDLEDCQKQATRMVEVHEMQLNARHSHRVAALEKEIEELNVQLAQEKKDHSRTRKGLEHLQKHFSSLPFQGEGKRKTMVTEDELKTWSY